MVTKTNPTFGDDAPKINPWIDDRLDYAPFAKRLAQVIIGLSAPNGYVIGLNGQWGSGKSTAVNFLLAFLSKHNEENESNRLIHLDFRPWIVAGHQDLISAFFKVLSEKLQDKHDRRVSRLRRALKPMRGTTDNLVDAAAILALSIDPSGGVASRYGGVLAKKTVGQQLDRFLEDPSIQVSYEKLKTQLEKSGKRIFVTIDDIDRLERVDIRSLMQMVKSTGQLPNVIYLLAYDRQIVADALDVRADGGPHFAEKIIQQEVELPFPSQSALLSLLEKEIEFITADTPSSLRWQYILCDGVHRWIGSPRDVVRLSNALKFLWPAIVGEVDPQDVVCMEGIRLFDAHAFDWIRRNRDLLFHQGRFQLASEKSLKDAFGKLSSQLPEADRESILRLISMLFPQRADDLDKSEMGGHETFADVIKRRGIGSEAGFDTYFSLRSSIDAVPKVVIDDLVKSSDPIQIATIITGYLEKKNRRGESFASILIDELRSRFSGKVADRPTPALFNAIFEVAEPVMRLRWEAGLFQLSPRAQLSFLIRGMLQQWGEDKAGRQLLEQFEQSENCGVMADVYVDRGRELGIFPANGSERPVIERAVFDQLGFLLLAKIEKAASAGTLAQAPFYFDIVRAWSYLGGMAAAQVWLSDGINTDPQFMAKVGLGLVSYSIGSSPLRRYTMREQPDLKLYDLNTLAKAGSRYLQIGGLDDDTTALLTELVRGSEQLLKGRSPEATREDLDDS